MIPREVALEALSALCNANVTSTQRQGGSFGKGTTAPARHQLFIKHFIPTVLDADDTCEVSRSSFVHIKNLLKGTQPAAGFARVSQVHIGTVKGKPLFIDENEFFDPKFDYDFTNLRDTETYSRGGEVYERPCGWQRFALRVLNDYGDNAWLGTSYRSTQSVPGEWPVSYHGTSKSGAEGIIEGHYEPGSGQVYGRGIYSTPFMADAIIYAKAFTSNTTGKRYKVILQNRINPQYREKHYNDRYWLIPIPKGTPDKTEQMMVERAIRPYGLLLKEI